MRKSEMIPDNNKTVSAVAVLRPSWVLYAGLLLVLSCLHSQTDPNAAIRYSSPKPAPVNDSKPDDKDLIFFQGNGGLRNYELKRVVDLRGTWKFETGDNRSRSQPQYDDSNWSEVFVPGAWEDEGFPGYDGYGWYRRKFEINSDLGGKQVYLYLGYIDDMDDVYINGHFIGRTGSFPPFEEGREYFLRRYLIPRRYLNFSGENTIAVRVYDLRLSGGIVRGKQGLYVNTNEIIPEQDLSGDWKFRIGDRMKYAEPDYDDANWNEIYAPSPWEFQGYPDYDGYAWYRKHVTIDAVLQDKKLVVMLGMIDDYAVVYFNGHLIGDSDFIEEAEFRPLSNMEWQIFRVHYLPPEFINPTGDNVIAVRVYDGFIHGGIYDGPIGLLSQEGYKKHATVVERTIRDKKNSPDQDIDNFLKWMLWEIFGK
ncbi:MAG: sugar-binding domain-containing protein [Candidatus Neomarinimicrobiota bacterium]